MRVCESCGAEVSSELQFCPNCGRRLPGDKALQSVPPKGRQWSGHDKPFDKAHKPAAIQVTGVLTPKTGHLEFLGGPEDGRIIRLSGERVTVGRREDNDVHIYSDTALSRRHAFIYRRDDQFWIEDRKSSFGTWVDGERVPVETAAPMHDGSRIRLARTTLLFHQGEPEEVELREMVGQIEW